MISLSAEVCGTDVNFYHHTGCFIPQEVPAGLRNCLW